MACINSLNSFSREFGMCLPVPLWRNPLGRIVLLHTNSAALAGGEKREKRGGSARRHSANRYEYLILIEFIIRHKTKRARILMFCSGAVARVVYLGFCLSICVVFADKRQEDVGIELRGRLAALFV